MLAPSPWLRRACALLLILTRPCLAQCGLWQEVRTDPPDPTPRPALVFAPAEGRTLLLGEGTHRGVFAWDGVSWHHEYLTSTFDPTLSPGGAYAFDSARNTTVLLAGGITWELGGRSWAQRSYMAPTAHYYAAMAYDSIRHKTVLFGGTPNSNGNTSALRGDTWEWDGAAWQWQAVSGPSPRLGHTMAFDSTRGRVVLYGGSNATASLFDTWEWDGAAWTQRQASGPNLRTACMAFDSQRSRTVMVGNQSPGATTPASVETWEWDGQTWSQRSTVGPAYRVTPGVAFDSVRRRIVLFGGIGTAGQFADTWEWDGSTWTQRALDTPAARSGHAAAYDTDRHRTLIFGGGRSYPFKADTWEWDGVNWSQRAVPGPAARTRAAMAYDETRHRAVLFGGSGYIQSSPTVFGDTWEWDGAAWTQVASAGPSPRTGHAMVYDHSRGRTLLYGGRVTVNGTPTDLRDVWEWDGAVWTRLADGPRALSFPVMTYDTVRNLVVLYLGGFQGAGYIGEVWEGHGPSWTQRGFTPPNSSSERSAPSMAYDPVRQRTMMFGGCCMYGDIREWDGNVWTQRAFYSGYTRSETPMVYDTARSCLVLFGGYDGTVVECGNLLELPSTAAPPRIASHPVPQRTTNGGVATFTVVADGVGPLTYKWYAGYHDPVLLTQFPLAREIVGAVSPMLTLTGVFVQPYGNLPVPITCKVSNACGDITTNAAFLTVLACSSADFNNDGQPGTDADIDAFFACLAGRCCSACGSVDFNGDGDVGTDQDIEAFFRVLAGGDC